MVEKDRINQLLVLGLVMGFRDMEK